MGTFEADEVTISSESSGRIIVMDVTEGSLVAGGVVIVVTDTIMAVPGLRSHTCLIIL